MNSIIFLRGKLTNKVFGFALLRSDVSYGTLGVLWQLRVRLQCKYKNVVASFIITMKHSILEEYRKLILTWRPTWCYLPHIERQYKKKLTHSTFCLFQNTFLVQISKQQAAGRVRQSTVVIRLRVAAVAVMDGTVHHVQPLCIIPIGIWIALCVDTSLPELI